MKQLRMGIRVEREHKGTVRWLRNKLRKSRRLPKANSIYKHIALDHLKENKRYYSKLRKCKL